MTPSAPQSPRVLRLVLLAPPRGCALWCRPYATCASTAARLGQPEGHLHGTIHLDRHGQGSAGLLPLSCLGVQRPQAPVAVGLEWAHVEGRGDGERLAVIRSAASTSGDRTALRSPRGAPGRRLHGLDPDGPWRTPVLAVPGFSPRPAGPRIGMPRPARPPGAPGPISTASRRPGRRPAPGAARRRQSSRRGRRPPLRARPPGDEEPEAAPCTSPRARSSITIAWGKSPWRRVRKPIAHQAMTRL